MVYVVLVQMVLIHVTVIHRIQEHTVKQESVEFSFYIDFNEKNTCFLFYFQRFVQVRHAEMVVHAML